MRMNQMANAKNPYQGKFKKVLCVCSAGLLRSPTAAVVLSSPPFNFNTRAAGLSEEYALIPVTEVLLHWCDEIVVMQSSQEKELRARTNKPIICLDIPDCFAYREYELVDLITKNYADLIKKEAKECL